jgi:hypothetical protein
VSREARGGRIDEFPVRSRESLRPRGAQGRGLGLARPPRRAGGEDGGWRIHSTDTELVIDRERADARL